jgi:hypothetical protein
VIAAYVFHATLLAWAGHWQKEAAVTIYSMLNQLKLVVIPGRSSLTDRIGQFAT